MIGDGTNETIKKCSGGENLVITFDCDLSFDLHIQKAISKANQMTGLIICSLYFILVKIFSWNCTKTVYMSSMVTLFVPNSPKTISVSGKDPEKGNQDIIRMQSHDVMLYENPLRYLVCHFLKPEG